MIELDTVKTVLAVFVVSQDRRQDVFVLQGVVYLNILFSKPEAVHTAHKKPGGVLHLREHTLGDIYVAVTDPHSIWMLHAVCDHRPFHQLVIPDAESKDASLEPQLRFVGLSLIIAHIEIPIRTKSDSHG